MWKSSDRGRSSPEDQASLERDFKQNVGGCFLPFFHNFKASHEHSEKNKGYILSNVSKVKKEKEKKRGVFHDFPKATSFGTEFISHSRKTNFND